MGAVRLWDVSHTYRHIKASFYGAVSVGESQPHPHIWHCGATVGAEGHKPWAVFSQQSFKEEVLSLWCLILMRHVHRSLFIIAAVMLLLLCVWTLLNPHPTEFVWYDHDEQAKCWGKYNFGLFNIESQDHGFKEELITILWSKVKGHGDLRSSCLSCDTVKG